MLRMVSSTLLLRPLSRCAQLHLRMAFLTCCRFLFPLGHSACMEQPSYPQHYGALPDRSAPMFAADSHEPRAPRPFEAASNDPYATGAVQAHPQPGAIAEGHSPMSSEFLFRCSLTKRKRSKTVVYAYTKTNPSRSRSRISGSRMKD